MSPMKSVENQFSKYRLYWWYDLSRKIVNILWKNHQSIFFSLICLNYLWEKEKPDGCQSCLIFFLLLWFNSLKQKKIADKQKVEGEHISRKVGDVGHELIVLS